MSTLRAYWSSPSTPGLLLAVVLSSGLTALGWTTGFTLNNALALLCVLTVATLWCYNRASAALLALLIFLCKPLLVRAAFFCDQRLSGSGGFDILGVTPALILSMLILLEILLNYHTGRRTWYGTSRILLLILVVLSMGSILYSANSLLVGLGGFERNILPNMLVLILFSSVMRTDGAPLRVLKALLGLGLVSCAYAVGQWLLGVYPWERDWLAQVAFRDDTAGWLTIGLRGVELRIFSLFYNYMDFFFTNVLVFVLVMVGREHLRGGWRVAGLLYFMLWALVLVLSLERMPLVMCALSVALYAYHKSPPARRRWVVGVSLAILVTALGALRLVAPALLETDASTLNRLAELANPLSAGSILDRKETKWGPTLRLIGQHPMGLGIGYGSESLATEEAKEKGLHIQPHNELLQKALEIGFVGAIVYLLLLVSVYLDARRLSLRGLRDGWFGRAMVIGSAAFWLCGLVNLPFSGSPGLVYWAMAGLVLAQLEITGEHSGETIPRPTDGPNEGNYLMGSTA